MFQIRFLTAFISLCILQGVQAQELFPVQNFAPEIYHGETQNWDICQSDTKLIYVANNKGLLEFNGSNWKLYPSPNHTIMRSAYAKGNRIYTGCYREFGYWQKDEFLNLKYTSLSNKIQDKLLEDEQFWNITGYQQWTLFQSLHRIYIYDTVTNTIKIITSKTNLPKMFLVGNQIYFQKMHEGIFRLENGKPFLVSNASVFKENIIINIFVFEDKLLIQTQENGFFVIDKDNISPWKTESTAEINALNVYSSLQLHDGSFVLGTVGEGVYLLSREGKIIRHIDKKSGLQNNTVLSIFEDADNNIWLGCDNGISLLNYTSPYQVFQDTQGVFGTVYAVAYHQNYLYLGTNQGLFYKTAKTTDDFKLIYGTKGQVWVLKVIDNTLFCGHNSGTFIVNGGKADLICNQLGTWDIRHVENNPNLLIQGNYEGLNILEKSNGNWRYRNKIEGFDISSRYFELMPDNKIFVNHEYRGVYKLDVTPDYKRITKIKIESSAPVSFNSGLVKYHEKLLYFAESGVYEYHPINKAFKKSETLTNIILGDDTYSSGKIIQDENQTYWAFTKDNITAISSGKMNDELNIHRVAMPLFIRENVVGFENITHLGNEIYLLGNTNGYVLFNLNKIADKEYIIQLNSIKKNKKNRDEIYIPVLSKNYKLKSSENNIKFSYNVPVFDKFTFVQYQYKLEG
ncbi:MAG: two component regulator propeller domain protein, partial [Bacteroidetes bacterium]|nr:two component regulator propeller domain protein [Bacteroidota bacterium]